MQGKIARQAVRPEALSTHVNRRTASEGGPYKRQSPKRSRSSRMASGREELKTHPQLRRVGHL